MRLHRRVRHLLTVAFSLALFACWPSATCAQSDAASDKLIERFPDADSNKDGKLSAEELHELKKNRKKGADGGPRQSKDEKEASRRAKRLVEPTYTDVTYGPHERNTLDFWKADTSTPAPVMILIHAGGFSGGDKSFWYTHPLLSFCNEHGISIASINYRLIRSDPYPAPMHDAARAIQFLRDNAVEWNIDPAQIAAAGGSAGACIAVWLATHDDLADASSVDPVARRSTRLKFVVSYDGQTCLDPRVNVAINSASAAHPWYRMLFGAASSDDLESDRVRKLIDDASATKHVTADDPPVYMLYHMDLTPIPLARGEMNMHHPHFGVMLKEKMDSLGLESVLHYQSKPARANEDLEFILEHFELGD